MLLGKLLWVSVSFRLDHTCGFQEMGEKIPKFKPVFLTQVLVSLRCDRILKKGSKHLARQFESLFLTPSNFITYQAV
jgi:hypothetical protein